MSPAPQRCSFHDQRPAFARCMACTKLLCQECATQWDGIWHCAACLSTRRGATRQRSPVLSWLFVIFVSLACLYLGTRVMMWTGAVIAGLF